MSKDNEELKMAIKRFYGLLKKYPNDSKSTYDFLSFIRYLLKLSSKDPLPATEIMTLIKSYKPAVYNAFKEMSKQNMMLGILTDNTMRLPAAEEKLEELLEK